MSRTDITRRPVQAATRWIAALPVAGLLAACASLAPSGADPDRAAMIDFKSCAKPVYPKADLAAGHQGTVHLAFLVTADGRIAESRVKTSSGYPGLDEAALTTLSQCQFKPARKNGQPVQAWQSVQYVWTTK